MRYILHYTVYIDNSVAGRGGSSSGAIALIDVLELLTVIHLTVVQRRGTLHFVWNDYCFSVVICWLVLSALFLISSSCYTLADKCSRSQECLARATLWTFRRPFIHRSFQHNVPDEGVFTMKCRVILVLTGWLAILMAAWYVPKCLDEDVVFVWRDE